MKTDTKKQLKDFVACYVVSILSWTLTLCIFEETKNFNFKCFKPKILHNNIPDNKEAFLLQKISF